MHKLSTMQKFKLNRLFKIKLRLLAWHVLLLEKTFLWFFLSPTFQTPLNRALTALVASGSNQRIYFATTELRCYLDFLANEIFCYLTN